MRRKQKPGANVFGDQVSDITLEHLITDAMSGDRKAFTSLVLHPKMSRLIDDVSAWAAWKYQQDRDDVRQVIVIALYNRITTLRDASHLEDWCYAITRGYSLNEIRHRKKEISYLEDSKSRSQQAKKREGKPFVEYETASTPEEDFLMEKGMRRATRSFPKEIVGAWVIGKSPKQIAQETGRPISTIYRILKNIRRAIIDETLSEIGTMRSQMQATQSKIESEKELTRSILAGLRTE